MSTSLRILFAWTPFRLCLVLWSFGYVLVDIGASLQGRTPLGVMLFWNLPLLALGIAQSLAVARLLDRLGARHPLLTWSLIAIAVVLAGAIQTLADHSWLKMLALTLFPAWQEWALSTDTSRILTIYLLYTWTMALSVALIWSARTNDLVRMNEARAAAFEAAAAQAEAAALRLQLNPHFLFNTLNAIASLVVRRKVGQAEEMIGRLADFLRSSLSSDPTAMIPLAKELATVRAYLHIEEARFGDRMRVLYQVDDDALQMLVPNFLMQPLVENAVKHGVAPFRRGATIEVGARTEDASLILSVANMAAGAAGRERPSHRAGETLTEAGLGLENTRRRLQNLYGERAWVKCQEHANGYRCEIGLPASLVGSNQIAAE